MVKKLTRQYYDFRERLRQAWLIVRTGKYPATAAISGCIMNTEQGRIYLHDGSMLMNCELENVVLEINGSPVCRGLTLDRTSKMDRTDEQDRPSDFVG